MADKTPYLIERLKHYRKQAAAQDAAEQAGEDNSAWFKKLIWEARAETMENVLDVLGVQYD